MKRVDKWNAKNDVAHRQCMCVMQTFFLHIIHFSFFQYRRTSKHARINHKCCCECTKWKKYEYATEECQSNKRFFKWNLGYSFNWLVIGVRMALTLSVERFYVFWLNKIGFESDIFIEQQFRINSTKLCNVWIFQHFHVVRFNFICKWSKSKLTINY